MGHMEQKMATKLQFDSTLLPSDSGANGNCHNLTEFLLVSCVG
jgi:hypothetical protein